jgi:hypothetical protein
MKTKKSYRDFVHEITLGHGLPRNQAHAWLIGHYSCKAHKLGVLTTTLLLSLQTSTPKQKTNSTKENTPKKKNEIKK